MNERKPQIVHCWVTLRISQELPNQPTCSLPSRYTGVSGMKRSMMKKGALWPASTRLSDCHSNSAPSSWQG